MSAVATYGFYADLDRDGDYDLAEEDLSAYVRADPGFEAQIGFDRPYEQIARSNSLVLKLHNADKTFSPETPGALTTGGAVSDLLLESGDRVLLESGDGLILEVPTVTGLTRHTPVKLTATYNAATVTLFTGRIAAMRPVPGLYGERATEIRCDGYFQELQRGNSFAMAAQEDLRSDQAISAVLHAARTYPVGFVGWFAGIDGFSNAGGSTIATDLDLAYFVSENGAETFGVVGDHWSLSTSPYRALSDLVEAEHGKLFERADGKVQFWNRHHFYSDLPNAVDATLTGSDLRQMEYEFAEGIVNHVIVTCRQREVDDQVTVLGTIEREVSINFGTQGFVDIPFRNAAGEKIGGIDLAQPVPGDYNVVYYDKYNARAGTVNAQDDLAISMTPIAGGARWFVVNLHPSRHLHILRGEQRGRRVTDFTNVTRQASSPTSIASYGYEVLKLSREALDDADTALGLAEHIVNLRKDAEAIVPSLTFIANKSAALMTHALSRAMGDRIAVSEDQTGHSAEYFIIGITHAVRRRVHTVTWYLEKAPPTPGWLAGTTGYSNAGTTTYAIF